jgi:hypothetical protein
MDQVETETDEFLKRRRYNPYNEVEEPILQRRPLIRLGVMQCSTKFVLAVAVDRETPFALKCIGMIY